jgi:hypothetical protein
VGSKNIVIPVRGIGRSWRATDVPIFPPHAHSAEVDVFQIGCDGFETFFRQGIGQHVQQSAAAGEAGGKDVHAGAVAVQFDLVDRAAPHAAIQRADRLDRLAGEQHLALADDGHARAQVGDVLDDMCGQDHHHAFADLGEQVEEAVAFLRIESRGGLVDDHQARIADQRLGNAEALAHAAGVGAELALAHVPQVHLAQQRLDQFAPFALHGDALEHGEVFQHRLGRDLRIHAELLRQIAEQAAGGLLVGEQVHLVELDRARVRILQRGDRAHQ